MTQKTEEDLYFDLMNAKRLVYIEETKEIWQCPSCYRELEHFWNECECKQATEVA